MALPTDAAMYGMAVQKTVWDDLSKEFLLSDVELGKFFELPEPGEVNPFPINFHFRTEPYDDGGGAAIAGIRFGACPFA